MHKLLPYFLLLLSIILTIPLSVFSQTTQSNFEQDRKAILSMAGCYKVTFDYAETFAPDTAYNYHKRYHAAGTEYVFVLEDKGNLIVLQHLLLAGDTGVIKHWRQDWVYENSELLAYTQYNEWTKTTLPVANTKGQWAQKVYQVDDGPRYESNGTWVHVDGRHFWQSTCDAPLPRREHTKRNDYNLLRRHNHIEVTSDGWFLEQDNEKIIRDSTGNKLLCREKGMEAFTKGEYDCSRAVSWWQQNKDYWTEVRQVWQQLLLQYPVFRMEKNPGDAQLWFKLVKVAKETNQQNRRAAIKETIEAYIKKS